MALSCLEEVLVEGCEPSTFCKCLSGSRCCGTVIVGLGVAGWLGFVAVLWVRRFAIPDTLLGVLVRVLPLQQRVLLVLRELLLLRLALSSCFPSRMLV